MQMSEQDSSRRDLKICVRFLRKSRRFEAEFCQVLRPVIVSLQWLLLNRLRSILPYAVT